MIRISTIAVSFIFKAILSFQGDSPRAPAAPIGDRSSTWSISPKDRKQYDGIFDVRSKFFP